MTDESDLQLVEDYSIPKWGATWQTPSPRVWDKQERNVTWAHVVYVVVVSALLGVGLAQYLSR
jgi:hypothetical protein